MRRLCNLILSEAKNPCRFSWTWAALASALLIGDTRSLYALDASPSQVIEGKPLSEWLGLAGGLAYSGKDKADADRILSQIEWGNEPAIRGLFSSMRDARWPVAYTAGQQLKRFGTNAVPLLIEGTQDTSQQMRHSSMAALAEMRPVPAEAIPVALSSLADPYDQVCGQANFLLQRAGRENPNLIVPALAKVLVGDDEKLRLQAMLILENVGPAVKEALPALREALRKTAYKPNAASVIADAGTNGIPILIEALGDADSEVAKVAIVNLRRFPDGTPRATTQFKPFMDSLLKALSHQDQSVRTQTAFLYSLLDPAAAAPVPALIEALLKDRSKDVRWEAALALSRRRHETQLIIPALMQALDDPEWMVRGQAAEALGAFGPDAKDALTHLKVLLNESEGPYPPHPAGKTDLEIAHDKLRMAIYLIERPDQRLPQ